MATSRGLELGGGCGLSDHGLHLPASSRCPSRRWRDGCSRARAGVWRSGPGALFGLVSAPCAAPILSCSSPIWRGGASLAYVASCCWCMLGHSVLILIAGSPWERPARSSRTETQPACWQSFAALPASSLCWSVCTSRSRLSNERNLHATRRHCTSVASFPSRLRKRQRRARSGHGCHPGHPDHIEGRPSGLYGQGARLRVHAQARR